MYPYNNRDVCFVHSPPQWQDFNYRQVSESWIEVQNVKNIILIGFMGVGKTTIGRRVSAELKIDFYDTDEYIKKCEKITPPGACEWKIE